MHLAAVIPVYQARECLAELHQRLSAAMAAITGDYEIIMVEDGGSDGSWEKIAELAALDPKLKGIKLSRNFGQHYAITAGLDKADADWVIIMDCDLQDPPEEIAKLYARAKEGGTDLVLALRMERQDSTLKILLGRWFYRVLGWLSGTRFDPRVGAFRLMSRKAVLGFRSMREQMRYFGAMVSWTGFRTATVEVAHAPRFAGSSSYTFRSMLRLATSGVLSFSSKPLHLSIYTGLFFSFGAVFYGAVILARKLIWGIPVEGWTTLIVSIYFLSGLILLNLGVVGLYVGHIFTETKARPLYLVEESVNL